MGTTSSPKSGPILCTTGKLGGIGDDDDEESYIRHGTHLVAYPVVGKQRCNDDGIYTTSQSLAKPVVQAAKDRDVR
jgi:hypothetical protein